MSTLVLFSYYFEAHWMFLIVPLGCSSRKVRVSFILPPDFDLKQIVFWFLSMLDEKVQSNESTDVYFQKSSSYNPAL